MPPQPQPSQGLQANPGPAGQSRPRGCLCDWQNGASGIGPRIEIRLVCINVISNGHRQGGLRDGLSGRAALYQRQLFAPVSACVCLPLTSLTSTPCFTAPYRPRWRPLPPPPPREASVNITAFLKDRGLPAADWCEKIRLRPLIISCTNNTADRD